MKGFVFFQNRLTAFNASCLAAAMSAVVSAPMAQAEVSKQTQQAIQNQLMQMAPNAPLAKITETPFADLYQVQIGMDVIYMSGNGQYLISGNMIDLKTRQNLTETVLNTARKEAVADIPVDSMIVYAGEGSDNGKQGRFMTVFTDIDCPYCTKLHKEIPELNKAGITVRYLAYPRAGVGSKSYSKAVSVWCSDKQTEAMDNAMNKLPVETKSCDNPVQDHLRLTQEFGINGTPNIVLDNGELLPGYVPANELVKIFKNPA